MSFKSSLRAFGAKPLGYIVLSLFIAMLSGFALGYLLIPVGAIILLAFAFGLPIYFGWNTSLKKFLGVALIVLLVGPLFTGVATTSSVLTPTPALSSSDGVLQNATVSPFQNSGGHPTFTFQVDVFPANLNDSLRLRYVYLWVTNCESDTDVNSSQGLCYLSPPDHFVNTTAVVNATDANTTGKFTLDFVLTGLPTGQVFYFLFLTAVSEKAAASPVYWAFSTYGGGWSCTEPPTYSSCTWAEGPVSASYGGVYAFLAPGDYISMALTVAVLAGIILVYAYLKGRERRRKAEAKAAAGGEDSTPSTPEVRCPHCNAVVESGEKTCWKCKKDLSAPPDPTSSRLKSTPLPSGPPSSTTTTAPDSPTVGPSNDGGSGGGNPPFE